MKPELAFIIGAPRSGTTMLERIISGHSQVTGGAEPHLMTPLAHLGVWRNVDKAPYDHIVAGIGQKDFINLLPQKEQTYWQACRAYADTLYSAYIQESECRICLDKTPEYATVWPFLKHVYPDAKYIVVSRHPAAIFSSFANSFFDGDYELTQQHDPLFERYIPAISGLLRDTTLNIFHLRYEDLVSNPDQYAQEICEFLGISYESEIVNYGAKHSKVNKGLGDPIGLSKDTRPNDKGISRWARELAIDQKKYDLVKSLLSKIDREDLLTYGYNPNSIWQAVEDALQENQTINNKSKHSSNWSGYKLQRKLIIKLRNSAQQNTIVRNVFEKLRLVCDVTLREY